MYSSVIGLLASGREIDLKDLFSHELAPVPAATFNENGMKICKTKSVLKRNLQVEMSNRTENCTVMRLWIDGSALLWTINCPSEGTVNDFVTNVKNRVKKYLRKLMCTWCLTATMTSVRSLLQEVGGKPG